MSKTAPQHERSREPVKRQDSGRVARNVVVRFPPLATFGDCQCFPTSLRARCLNIEREGVTYEQWRADVRMGIALLAGLKS